jgi:penicillin amidase
MKPKMSYISYCTLACFLWTGLVWADVRQATIKRDNYGAPHIYSDTTKGLFFGFGYALAQDRLYQIEMFRRTFWGRLSEVYGDTLLPFDQSNRRDNLTPAEVRRQIGELDHEVQEAIAGFSAGINHYITEAMEEKSLKLPKEFHHFGFVPEPWVPEDVIANFLSVMGFFMDVSSELMNAAMLNYLNERYGPDKARAIFDDWCWGYDPNAPIAISSATQADSRETETASTASEGGDAPLARRELSASLGLAHAAQTALVKERLGRRIFAPPNFPYSHPTSYAAVISSRKSATGAPMLFGGPQFDFQIPSVCYEVGLHGAGIDAVGTTIAGYPFVMFGHNRRAAYTSTAGLDNIEDIFTEKLNPENPRQYWFKGEWREMEVRKETFSVKGQEPVTEEFLYTVHGPVFFVDKEKHLAFSKRLSCGPRFVQGLASYYQLMKAETVQQFYEAAELSDMSLNYFFASVDGDIAYFHLGLHPERAEGVDVRLPTPGTGEFEWKGFRPKSQNPHGANPVDGYLVNQNQQPQKGWGHGDLASTEGWGGWGEDNRVQVMAQLAEAREKLTREDFANIIEAICFYDLRALNTKELMLDALKDVPSLTPREKEALKLMARWDNQHLDKDRNGFYDHAGSALFDRWWKKAVPAIFEEWFRGYTNPLGMTAVDMLLNRYTGYTLLLKALKGTSHMDYFKGNRAGILLGAFRQALQELGREQPDKAVEDFRMKALTQRFASVTVLGHFLNQPITSSVVPAEEAPAFPTSPGYLHNRGAINHIVCLGPVKPSGVIVNAPGNSGFIRADGVKSPHFYDQVGMFIDFTYKPMLFTEEDVSGATGSTCMVKWK